MEGAHGDAIGAASRRSCSMRSRISRAALLVKVTARMRSPGPADLHEVGDTVGEDPRLARAGTGDDKHRSAGGEHSFALRVIQPGEKFSCDGGRDRIQGRRSAPEVSGPATGAGEV